MGIVFLYYIEDGFKSKPVTNNGFLLRFYIKLRLWIVFRPHMVKVYVMNHFYISVFLHVLCIPYSQKIWWGIKFGGLAVRLATAKLKSANISYLHIYVWQSRTEPPNLNPPMFLQW